MAKGFAIHNAPTNHGGVIPSTQQRTSQMGNLFVRAGDGHYCPKCKCWSEVIKVMIMSSWMERQLLMSMIY